MYAELGYPVKATFGQDLLGSGAMTKVIGEALEQLKFGVDLVEMFGPANLIRVFQQVFRVDEYVSANAITYCNCRPTGDHVLALEPLKAVQQSQQTLLQHVVGVAIVYRH